MTQQVRKIFAIGRFVNLSLTYFGIPENQYPQPETGVGQQCFAVNIGKVYLKLAFLIRRFG
jgi:hypothetical protein